MLKIRLARTGRKKLVNYRVVVSDSRRTPTGGFVARLGHYNPHSKELVIDAEKTQGYIDNGAQMSSRMVRLLQQEKGIKLPAWALKNLVVKESKPKKEVEPAAEATKVDEAAKADEATDEAEATPEEAPAENETSSDEEAAAEPEAEPEAEPKEESKEEPKDEPKEEPKKEEPKEEKAE